VIDVAIVGAAGYAGVEAARLVLGHSGMRLVEVTSTADAGARLDRVYPALSGQTDLVLSEPDIDRICGRAQLVFLGVPHTAALELVGPLLDHGVKVVDASADFRLKDPSVYEAWYGVTHTAPDLLAEAVYGLPELDRSALPGARLVACPGCYPTAAILAALPALESGVAEPEHIVVDAKSGVSGAGRKASAGTHFPAVNESVAPYKVAEHRHTPEIEQALSKIAGGGVTVTFTPHLVPMTRGLLATVYLRLWGGSSLTTEDAVELYRTRYDGEPFVAVHPVGVMPSTREVSGSNRVHIGVAVDARTGTLIAVSAIDNLVKGTSGQALQCANLALGLEETEGLTAPAAVV
jgi:N-acetyl-gamma-glutamyl-phosphate reductase